MVFTWTNGHTPLWITFGAVERYTISNQAAGHRKPGDTCFRKVRREQELRVQSAERRSFVICHWSLAAANIQGGTGNGGSPSPGLWRAGQGTGEARGAEVGEGERGPPSAVYSVLERFKIACIHYPFARRVWSTSRRTPAAGPDSFSRAIVIFLKEKSGICLTNCTA